MEKKYSLKSNLFVESISRELGHNESITLAAIIFSLVLLSNSLGEKMSPARTRIYQRYAFVRKLEVAYQQFVCIQCILYTDVNELTRQSGCGSFLIFGHF